MNENKIKHDDGIDLVELLMTLWDGKWKIIASAFLFIVGAVGFLALSPSTFTAKTEIRPINSITADGYRLFNALGFFEINPTLLLSIYMEKLEDRSAFEIAIRKHELLDRNDFENDEDYDDAIKTFAFDIEFKPPINADGVQRGESRRFWTLSQEYDDEEKWTNTIVTANKIASEAVRQAVSQRFVLLSNQTEQEKKFQLEDIATLIENKKEDFDKDMAKFELNHSFQLEDMETKIANVLNDHKRRTVNRLAFLKEQAAIARQLKVAKNTLETQIFATEGSILTNVETNAPFYLRGYEAIEKEIEIIGARENPESFVDGLLELEQQKRMLEQDKTLQRAGKNKQYLDALLELEGTQRLLKQDRGLERAKALFSSTPLMNADDFSAASLEVATTDFDYDLEPILILALSVIMGGIVGTVYVFVNSAVRSRRGSKNLSD